jgi:hypothetical protein
VPFLPHRPPCAAEEVGFEPTVSFPTHDFQSCRFGRSRTPPDDGSSGRPRGQTVVTDRCDEEHVAAVDPRVTSTENAGKRILKTTTS